MEPGFGGRRRGWGVSLEFLRGKEIWEGYKDSGEGEDVGERPGAWISGLGGGLGVWRGERLGKGLRVMLQEENVASVSRVKGLRRKWGMASGFEGWIVYWGVALKFRACRRGWGEA